LYKADGRGECFWIKNLGDYYRTAGYFQTERRVLVDGDEKRSTIIINYYFYDCTKESSTINQLQVVDMKRYGLTLISYW